MQQQRRPRRRLAAVLALALVLSLQSGASALEEEPAVSH